jgi:hypothetical protein
LAGFARGFSIFQRGTPRPGADRFKSAKTPVRQSTKKINAAVRVMMGNIPVSRFASYIPSNRHAAEACVFYAITGLDNGRWTTEGA